MSPDTSCAVFKCRIYCTENEEHLNLALSREQYFTLIKISTAFFEVEAHRDTSELIDGG